MYISKFSDITLTDIIASIYSPVQQDFSPLIRWALDWEWNNRMIPNPNKKIKYISQLNKILGEIKPIFGTFLKEGTYEILALEHPSLKSNLEPTWDGNSVFMALRGLDEVSFDTKPKKVVKLVNKLTFFFSPLDILFCYANKDTQIAIAKQLVKHRTLKTSVSGKDGVKFGIPLKTGIYAVDKAGVIYEEYIELDDQCGKGVGGLKAIAASWGITLEDKGLMDDWKSDMLTAYKSTSPSCLLSKAQETSEGIILHDWCIKYGKGDTDKLFEIDQKSYQKACELWRKLGFPENIKPRHFNTIGGLTNQTSVMKLREALGILETTTNKQDEISFLFKNEEFLATALLPYSKETLDSLGGTAKLLASIDGGFCKNMKPTLVRALGLILDIDIKGCYGNGLMAQNYPLGRPVIWHYQPNRPKSRATLGEFIKFIDKEGVPGCWIARISTDKPLTFEQDILISKHFKSTTFEESEDSEGFSQVDSDDKLNDIPGDFQLNTKEFTCAILNHDILQVLRGCSTKTERDELYKKVYVDCCAVFPKSSYVDIENFKAKYQMDGKVTFTFNKDFTLTTKDSAKYLWTSVPMGSNWIETLLKERKCAKTELSKLKKRIKSLQKIEPHSSELSQLKEQAQNLDAFQNVCKLITNSTYGVMGSLHYQTEYPSRKPGQKIDDLFFNPKSGNPIVANNITARARVGVWAIAKALGAFQVITDGGALDINNVWTWDWQGKDKTGVGLDVLSKLSQAGINIPMREVNKNSKLTIKRIPLGNNGEWINEGFLEEIDADGNKVKFLAIKNNAETVKGFDDNWERLDELAFEHVANLFPMLDIFSQKQYSFASKDLFSGYAGQSQSNYYLKTFEDDKPAKIKARGYKLHTDSKGNPTARTYLTPDCNEIPIIHPYYKMIQDIFDGKPINPSQRVYTSELLGVADFNENDTVRNDYIERGLLPGMNIPRSSHPRPISLSMFRWQTRAQYLSWNKRHEKLRDKTGWGIEGYFLDKEGNVLYDKAVVSIQNAINEGEMWIVSSTSNNPDVVHPQFVADREFLSQQDSLD